MMAPPDPIDAFFNVALVIFVALAGSLLLVGAYQAAYMIVMAAFR